MKHGTPAPRHAQMRSIAHSISFGRMLPGKLTCGNLGITSFSAFTAAQTSVGIGARVVNRLALGDFPNVCLGTDGNQLFAQCDADRSARKNVRRETSLQALPKDRRKQTFRKKSDSDLDLKKFEFSFVASEF